MHDLDVLLFYTESTINLEVLLISICSYINDQSVKLVVFLWCNMDYRDYVRYYEIASRISS